MGRGKWGDVLALTVFDARHRLPPAKNPLTPGRPPISHITSLKMEGTVSKRILLILMCLLCALSAAMAQDVTFEKTRFTSPKMKTEASVSMRITDSQIYISGKNPKKFGDLVIPFSSIDSMTFEWAGRHRVGRGLARDRKYLFVIDGSKALRAAISAVFGSEHPVQRCR